jgi:hypothetical protein
MYFKKKNQIEEKYGNEKKMNANRTEVMFSLANVRMFLSSVRKRMVKGREEELCFASSSMMPPGKENRLIHAST